jgi:hypothetical protein
MVRSSLLTNGNIQSPSWSQRLQAASRCRSIQAAHFTYFLLMLKEKTDQFSITILANTPFKTRTCRPGRLVIHRYVFL